MKSIGRRKALLIVVVALVVLSPVLYFPLYSVYSRIDRTTFPDPWPEVRDLNAKMSDRAKGAALARSITWQLRREMDSGPLGLFGWSVNDIIIAPDWLYDNRASRQRGVIFATRMLAQFFSTKVTKYGQADEENESFKEARSKYFFYDEDVWMPPMWTEGRYEKGIAAVDKYADDLVAGKPGAVYNMRSDDIYNFLVFINSENLLDQPMGKLVQSNEEVPFNELDDRVYYAQGVILVVRDFLTALIKMYPEITEKGGKKNITIGLKTMDRICTFDPWIVLRGDHDSMFADHRGKLARYMIEVQKRIDDLAQSIRR